MQFIALDDRQLPGAGLGDGGRGLLPLVPGISEDKLDEGEEAACAPIEDEQSAVRPSGRRRSTASRACRPGYAVCGRWTFLAASKPCGSGPVSLAILGLRNCILFTLSP